MRLSLIMLASACSYADSEFLDTDRPDTSEPPTVIDTSTPVLQGDWLTINGEIVLTEGAISSHDIEAQLLVADEFGEIVPVSCGAMVGAGTPVEQPADEVSVYGMWEFDLDAGSCGGLPDTLALGVGPLLVDLWPAAESLGASLKHTRGMYTTRPGQPGLVVFGLAATTEQFEGAGTPTSLSPLPDGRYFLRTAYLLPL